MVRAPRACNEGRARTENRGGHRGGKTAGQHERDRKSTRLNSSHDQISYAVFCLKKKKIKRIGGGDREETGLDWNHNLLACHLWCWKQDGNVGLVGFYLGHTFIQTYGRRVVEYV